MAARSRADRARPRSTEESSRSRGVSSAIGRMLEIDLEVLCMESLRDGSRHAGAGAAVLGEDHYDDLGILSGGERSEPGVVPELERKGLGFGAGGLRDDLHGAGLAGHLGARNAGPPVGRP